MVFFAHLPTSSPLLAISRQHDDSLVLGTSRNGFEKCGRTRKWQHLRMPTPPCILHATSSSFEGGAEGIPEPVPVFPRIHVRDPYKLLGISREASEEEIQAARNYLLNQYAGHARSKNAIEAAYDRIIMESFRERKKAKPVVKRKGKEYPPWVRKLLSMYEVPTPMVLLPRTLLFLLLGFWSVINYSEGGPTFQVVVSLAGCIYLLHRRIKKIPRSCIIGFGAFVVGWAFASFLVPVLPFSLFQGPWSFELSSALISYIFLWFSCTFLK